MANDMDIDMEIDLGPDPLLAAQEAEAERLQNQVANDVVASNNKSMDASVVPEKVHIRGLDNLATEDIKRFANEHFPTEHFIRVEWVDDTSANIVYAEPEVANDALIAFTLAQDLDPTTIPTTQARPAKLLSTHPDTQLHVRQSISTDVKARGARDASRYYLMNPDKDPRERKRKERDENGDYRRNRFDDHEHRRRQRGDRGVPFDVNMYDDDAGSGSGRDNRRSMSFGSSDDRQRKRVRFDRGRAAEDLFSSRVRGGSDGRLRDRSASTSRDGDGRMGFAEDNTSVRSRIRQRSLTPPAQSRRREKGVELLGSLHTRPSALTSTTAASASNGRDLILDHPKNKPVKELFPHKTAISNHRRTDAIDASEPSSDSRNKPRDLFDRIQNPAKHTAPSTGRLKSTSDPVRSPNFSEHTIDQGISIKGAAQQDGVHGFYIKGAAQAQGQTRQPRELFPLKSGGQDLFAEKLKGRGGPRKKAEDMFS